jgi:hypothetical protein
MARLFEDLTDDSERFWNESAGYVLVFKMPLINNADDEEGANARKGRQSCLEMIKFLKEEIQKDDSAIEIDDKSKYKKDGHEYTFLKCSWRFSCKPFKTTAKSVTPVLRVRATGGGCQVPPPALVALLRERAATGTTSGDVRRCLGEVPPR